MEKEQLYQTIEAFLEGELTGEELAAFEQELATDRSLAKEVQLHQRLQKQLGDAPKMTLRATLEKIAGEFPDSDFDTGGDGNPGFSPKGGGGASGGVPFWWFGLGFFLIIGGGVAWYLLARDDGAVRPSEMPAVEAPAPEMPEDANATTIEDTSEEPVAEEETPAPATTERPQAYNTIRDLELLIGEEPPSRRYIFSEGELNFMEQGDQSYLSYSGILTTSRSVDEGFFLSLYRDQYPEGRVLRVPLTFSEVDPDAPIAFAAKKEYIAAYTGETDLEPALYYGVVTVGESSIPLWVGKLRVE